MLAAGSPPQEKLSAAISGSSGAAAAARDDGEPAKNTKETKGLLKELDSRIKEVEEMGEIVSDSHRKSVLIVDILPWSKERLHTQH